MNKISNIILDLQRLTSLNFKSYPSICLTFKFSILSNIVTTYQERDIIYGRRSCLIENELVPSLTKKYVLMASEKAMLFKCGLD